MLGMKECTRPEVVDGIRRPSGDRVLSVRRNGDGGYVSGDSSSLWADGGISDSSRGISRLLSLELPVRSVFGWHVSGGDCVMRGDHRAEDVNSGNRWRAAVVRPYAPSLNPLLCVDGHKVHAAVHTPARHQELLDGAPRSLKIEIPK